MLHIIRCLHDKNEETTEGRTEGSSPLELESDSPRVRHREEGEAMLARLDLDDLVTTLEPVVKRGLHHPNSLLCQQRTTRSGGGEHTEAQNRPGRGLCRRWCAAARALSPGPYIQMQQHREEGVGSCNRRWLGRPCTPEVETVLNPHRCWGRIVASIGRHTSEILYSKGTATDDTCKQCTNEYPHNLLNYDDAEENGLLGQTVGNEFMDVIAGADVDCALAQARPGRERVVMLLACHLGMRVGAITRLRLYGIVEADDLHPGSESPWRVAERLRGHDKNHQINEWMVSLSPVLRTELEEFINHQWRPTHERWTTGRLGKPVLVNHFLFPSPRPSRRSAAPRSLKTDTVTRGNIYYPHYPSDISPLDQQRIGPRRNHGTTPASTRVSQRFLYGPFTGRKPPWPGNNKNKKEK